SRAPSARPLAFRCAKRGCFVLCRGGLGCVRVTRPPSRGGAVEPIWKKHWPANVDEKSIRLPEEPLTAILARQAKRVPDRPAIHFYGRAVTFAELDASAGRFAGFLQARGLSPGDRVAIFLENSPQFAIAYYGTL